MNSALAVLCGPSLSKEHRIASDRVTYLPPAARGDVTRAARNYENILLIDGVFHHNVATTPKEVYEALKRARVFGASSMGALRAAECARYGAIPLGIVARWFATEKLDGDDEVALLFDPATHRPLTVPSVNVRYLAWLAARRGILSKPSAMRFVENARAIYYAERDWDAVLSLVDPKTRAALNGLVHLADLKQHDARFALRSVLSRLSNDTYVIPT